MTFFFEIWICTHNNIIANERTLVLVFHRDFISSSLDPDLMARHAPMRKRKDPPPTPAAFSIRGPLVSLQRTLRPPLGIRILGAVPRKRKQISIFPEARGEATR
jgi:hypothetical protein